MAGCYFSVLAFVLTAFILPPLLGTTASCRFRVALGLTICPFAVMLYVLGVRRGWGERPDSGPGGALSLRHPLSTWSDRSLAVGRWMAAAAILFIGFELVAGPVRRPIDFISLGTAVGWLALITAERRRRARG